MELSSLIKRREEIVGHNAKMERKRDSGWHPGDHGAAQRERNGELPLSERVVMMQDDDRCYICGPDVETVLKCARDWVKALEPLAPEQLDATRMMRQSQIACKRLLGKPVGDYLEFTTGEWNIILVALAMSRPDEEGVFQGTQVTASSVATPPVFSTKG